MRSKTINIGTIEYQGGRRRDCLAHVEYQGSTMIVQAALPLYRQSTHNKARRVVSGYSVVGERVFDARSGAGKEATEWAAGACVRALNELSSGAVPRRTHLKLGSRE